MLHFISSIFTSKRKPDSGLDKTLIDRAIERVVDGTDPRLRGMGNYRKRLRPCVARAAGHIIDLVDAFPGAVEISRAAYSADPRLRAFFASAKRLHDVVAGSKALKDYIHHAVTPLPETLFVLLAMEMEEKKVLGMQLSGETLQRDVPQVAVNFFHHRFLGPSDNEDETSNLVKIRIFDYLIEQTLESIIARRSKRTELEQQHRLLKRKLEAMKAGNWGLESMLAETEPPQADRAMLESELADVEARLMDLGTGAVTLQRVYEAIDAVFGRPEDWVSRRDVHLKLSKMSIKLDDDNSRDAVPLELTELFSCSGERRIVLKGKIPLQDLPTRKDFI